MPESKVSKKASKKTKKPFQRKFQYEENTTRRKRIHNRLLKKIKTTVEEMVIRIGQQAMVLVVSPVQTSSSNFCEVYGAPQLVSVVKNLSGQIVTELKQTIKTWPKPDPNSNLFELPALIVNGMLTPVRHMTQAQLRTFIPLMMKYSTGRGKPGWGRPEKKPEWWPDEFVPWSNVRMDSRTPDQKSKISWTFVLQKIVINCYSYHGREDLLMLHNKVKPKHDQDEIKEECASKSVIVQCGELQGDDNGASGGEEDPKYNITIEIMDEDENEEEDEDEETSDDNNDEELDEDATIKNSHCQEQLAISDASNEETNTKNNNCMSLSLAMPPGSCLYGLKPNEDGTWYLLPADSNCLDVKVVDPLIFNIQESVNSA